MMATFVNRNEEQYLVQCDEHTYCLDIKFYFQGLVQRQGGKVGDNLELTEARHVISSGEG
jgi:hypothetical protein